MHATVKRITIPPGRRVICVSDIHGNLNLFRRLLKKVGYTPQADVLILLGDLYTKGKQGPETLRYIMELSQNANVHVLRGNCDWEEDYLSGAERDWLNALPHVIAAEDYIFVHAGITSDNLEGQDAETCMKNDAFLEQGLKFQKYVVTGHWPAHNYTHQIDCYNPIVDEESHIIAIDGGNVVHSAGQLNAFLITDGAFSFDAVDDFPTITVKRAQLASEEPLNITFNDRFVELLEDQGDFRLCRHQQTGRALPVLKRWMWEDYNGRLCAMGTDYHLPVKAGETVSVIAAAGGKILAKKNGIVGWINDV